MIRCTGMALLALALTYVGAGAGFALTPLPPACQADVALFPAAHRAIHIEIADDKAERAQGLMNREELAAKTGMLFIYETPRPASFWMKNTLIPLDMVFIRADGSIDRIAENTIPESLEPVVSGGEVSAVLELAGGTAARLGIDETAKITWKDTK